MGLDDNMNALQEVSVADCSASFQEQIGALANEAVLVRVHSIVELLHVSFAKAIGKFRKFVKFVLLNYFGLKVLASGHECTAYVR